MKKILLIISAILIVFSFETMVSADEDITVTLNNKKIECSDKPIIVDGRTMVPLRPICDAMNEITKCQLIWDSVEETATILTMTTMISMQIDNKWIAKKKLTGNGEFIDIQSDVAPILYNDRTYIPLRVIAEAMDAVVGWDETTRTVMIVFDTDLHYDGGYSISKFAGTGERQQHDGSTYFTSSFVSPESIDIDSSGRIYVGDGGRIRVMDNGTIDTIELEPNYLTVDMIRCYGNDLYVLTNEFKDEKDIKYFGLVKISNGNAQGLFITEAAYSKITDFTIANDGTMYVLQNNLGAGANYLGQMDIYTGKVNYLTELDNGITCLCTDSNGHIFLGNSTKGSLYRYNIEDKSLKLFAGVDNSLKFVDGPNAMFVEPRRMRYSDGAVYVLDYNIIRKITVDGNAMAIASESIAGKLSLDQNAETADGKASDAKIAPSYLMDFIVKNNEIIMTDPKNAVLRVIK